MIIGTEGSGEVESRRVDGFGPLSPPKMTDIQRQGWDEASRVITRFVDLLDDAPPPRPSDLGPKPVNDQVPEIEQLRRSVARALDLYTDLVQRSFESYADLMEQTLRARGLGLIADDRGIGLLNMCGAVGTKAVEAVWLHNTTQRSVSTVLLLTHLTAHDGSVVPACVGDFDPAAVNVGPGASAAVRLSVLLHDVAPGVYRGYVLAGGLQDAVLPIRLVVGDLPVEQPS